MTRVWMPAVVIAATVGLGCSGTETRAATQSKAAVDAAGKGPCALLTTGEVQRAFPNSKPGVLNREQEKYDILTCTWDTPTGLLSIISGKEEDTVREEAEGWTLIFLDPLRQDAKRHVRYETLAGVGDEAVAVIEREDKAKGFSQSSAYLVVRRGEHQVAVMSSDLAKRDRAEALQVLTVLGKAIAGRLE